MVCELETVGFLVSGYLLVRIACYFSKFFRTAVDVKSLGDWALVTGATDGIGKGFATELASRGINIVLVSRSADKLQDVAKELSEKYKVKTATIAVDFTNEDQVFSKISQGIKDLDGSIGLLVNNVGMSYEHPEYFLEIDDLETKSRNIVSCNVASVINVTRAVMPAMVQRKKGAVINISSASSLQSTPLLSLYSSTKAFVNQFSQDLQVEYKGKGITVQALAPFYVVSKLSKKREATFFIPMPDTYVKSALSTLGLETVSTGYWPHDIMLLGVNTLGFFGIQSSFIFNSMLQMRNKALKKKSKTN